MTYRAIWINKQGELVYGAYTSNIDTAKDEEKFKRTLGFYAWTENEECERVD